MSEKRLFCAVFMLLFLSGCCVHEQKLEKPPVVQEVFTTESDLKNPESVLFDPVTRQLFVANVNGHPLQKDGNGFISKVALNGDIRDAYWITGLNAPKGMTLIGDLLYIADIDELVVVDITNNNKQKYPISKALFLNDVTHDSTGTVYISDFFTDTIYAFKNGEISIWLQGDLLQSPNGLHVTDGSLYVANWGKRVDGFATETLGGLLRIDLKTKQIFEVTPELGNLDGLGQYGQFFILTDFMNGHLYMVRGNGEKVFDIEVGKGTADLCVLPSDWELLVIPMMNDNVLKGFSVQQSELN